MKFSAIAASLAIVGSALAIPASILGDKVPGDSPIELCDGDRSGDILQIKSLDISPNPPKAGQDLIIKATGTLSQTIEDGAYVKVQVKLGLIRLISQTFDLCEQSSNLDLSCPIKDGEITLQKVVTLPKEIPPAKFYVFADAYNVDDEQITCLTATADFMPHMYSEDL